jgi:hypothetical protein
MAEAVKRNATQGVWNELRETGGGIGLFVSLSSVG